MNRLFLIVSLVISTTVCSSQKLVSFKRVCIVDTKTNISGGYIDVVIPESYLGRQKILDIEFSRFPDEFLKIEGSKFARWKLARLRPGDSIIMVTNALISRYDLNTARKKKLNLKTEFGLENYLMQEALIQTNNKNIRSSTKIHGMPQSSCPKTRGIQFLFLYV